MTIIFHLLFLIDFSETKILLMKKILLILFCFYSFNLFSQDFNKGDKLIGGSLSFSVFNANRSGPGYYNVGNVGIMPSYSWFIKNNLAMGIRGSFYYSRAGQEFSNGEKRTVRNFNSGISVFLKKYKPLKEKFGVHFENQLGGHYVATKDKGFQMPETKNEAYGASYQFSPGVFYRFSKNFMGEGNIGGVYASYYGGQGSRNFGIGASFLQTFNLGVNYLLERKKS
jgi:hypothetical protein